MKNSLLISIIFALLAVSEIAIAHHSVSVSCGNLYPPNPSGFNIGTCNVTVTGANPWDSVWTGTLNVVNVHGGDDFATGYTCSPNPPENSVSGLVTAFVTADGHEKNGSKLVPCLSQGDLDELPTSPILIDLDRNGFHFSAGPVLFDINANDVVESISWTTAGELDGFLYLDRNGNGIVDDGSELFGNATILFNGDKAVIGYDALAEFDQEIHGGVEDGVIDSFDLIFADLRVWVDSNADGQFESSESFTMVEAGVVKIGLEYKELPIVDDYGNELRYNGDAWIVKNGKLKKTKTTDVYFVNYDLQ